MSLVIMYDRRVLSSQGPYLSERDARDPYFTPESAYSGLESHCLGIAK